MSTPNRLSPRRLADGIRRKLEVTSAMAWESLVDTHVEQATNFIHLMAPHEPAQEALPRYLNELDLGETMGAAIRTRVFMRLKSEGDSSTADETRAEQSVAVPPSRPSDDEPGADSAWALLRRPQRVMQDVIRRQRRNEEAERITQLALARAEEYVIRTHVENAIGFVALLQDQMPIDRSVHQYVAAIGLSGSRAQTVYQRTMAKLADVHLPS